MPFGSMRGYVYGKGNRVYGPRDYAYAKGKLSAPAKKQVRKVVKKAINNVVELKYFDIVANAVAISNSTTTFQNLFFPAQGGTDSERNADAVTLSGMRFRYQVRNNSLVSAFVQTMRVLIFQWHPSGAIAVPTPSNLFLNGASGSIDITSPMNHDNRQQYHVLYDRTHVMLANTNYGSYFVDKKLSFKMIQKKVQFTAGSTNGTNQIYLYYVSDIPSLNPPTFTGSFKTWYRDG
jgi:hypothetical protein